jgi:hypothetical protein
MRIVHNISAMTTQGSLYKVNRDMKHHWNACQQG